ncbi:Petal formation-expressed [Dillenia turbinata]|uniref:Petal formation-expressed n=1 Tax=Dillenia turbinata TaxID=194707 RepID=A0AAN8ZG83_9MAGN
MSAIASTCNFGAGIGALKASSTLLYLAATGMLIIMNKIQPSQLAEEQRNASSSRLFKQPQFQIQTKIALSSPTIKDVNEATEKCRGLEKHKTKKKGQKGISSNGWRANLDEEMREMVEVPRGKDIQKYLTLEQCWFLTLMKFVRGRFRDEKMVEVFEMVALQLGRGLSDLRNLASSSRSSGKKVEEEFASKLFLH